MISFDIYDANTFIKLHYSQGLTPKITRTLGEFNQVDCVIEGRLSHEHCSWLKKNRTGKVYIHPHHTYALVQNAQDAIMFKLLFG